MKAKFKVFDGEWETYTLRPWQVGRFWILGEFSYQPMKFLRAWLKR